MANRAVKFYAMSLEKYNKATKEPGGIYFVASGKDGMPGRIYRGDKLFGAARVTEYQYEESNGEWTLTVPDAVRGDVNISNKYGAEIFDGSKWHSLGASDEQIVEIVKKNINDTFDGLLGYETEKYDKSVEQLEELVNTPDNGWTKDDDGNYLYNDVKVADSEGNALDENGNTSDKSYVNVDRVTTSEITASTITATGDITTSGTVEASEVKADTITTETITAETITTTGDITTEGKVEADTVTASNINIQEEGKDDPTPLDAYVSAIASSVADDRIAAIVEHSESSEDGKLFQVTVTTSAGEVSGVDLVIPTIITGNDDDKIDADNASEEKLVTEKAVAEFVSDKISTLDNATKLIGVVTSLPETGMENGDIVIIGEAGENETLQEGLVTGQEYIYVKPNGESAGRWELIGDQSQLGELVQDVQDNANAIKDLKEVVTITKDGEGNITATDVTADTATLETLTIKNGGAENVTLTDEEKGDLVKKDDGFYESEDEGAKKVADKDGNKIGEDGEIETTPVDVSLAQYIQQFIKKNEMIWLGADDQPWEEDSEDDESNS